MAIDTKDKRASAIDAALPWRTELPDPSGTIGAGARQIIARLYSGILPTPPPSGNSGGEWLVIARRRGRR